MTENFSEEDIQEIKEMQMDDEDNKDTEQLNNESAENDDKKPDPKISNDVDPITSMIATINIESASFVFTPFQNFYEIFTKVDLPLPLNYDNGIHKAIEVIGVIQKSRDVISHYKAVTYKKLSLAKELWKKCEVFTAFHHPVISKYDTQTKKSMATQELFSDLYSKLQSLECDYTLASELLDNVIAKYTSCSRQIAILEMEIKLT